MRIRVLGPLLVGDPPATLSRRDRVVLSALTARRGMPCSAEVIGDALWGSERPPTWAKVVQGAIVRVRRALGHEAIGYGPDGYVLTVPGTEVDSGVFEDLLARGRQLTSVGEPARALTAYDEALALWRGRPLPDLDDWPTGQDEVRRLESLRSEVEEERVAVAVSTGRGQECLMDAQRLVREAPYRERRWELLALALYASGRQADALETVARAKRTLREDLGLDPGADLAALEQAILGHDPSLPSRRVRRSSDSCPYQGLVAFQPQHHDLFVGRESDALTCLRRLEEHPLLLIVGSSGSGKSSLARAGIVPELVRAGREVTVVVPGVNAVAELEEERRRARPGTALLVDQLEELDTCAEVERAAYLGLVADWVDTGPVILTLRSDRLDLLTASPRLSGLANLGLYLLPPLGPHALRRIVVEPAERVGLYVEPGLVDVLLRDVGERPAALPLLSHALRQTWVHREGDVLTVQGYAATGGIASAVAHSADGVYEGLDAEHQQALRSLLLRLVSITPEGTTVGTRLPTGPRTDEKLRTVIHQLELHRLVTVEDGAVALSHEALAQAWPRLRGWLEDDVTGRRVLEHLRVTAAGWAGSGRPTGELYTGARLASALEWRDVSAPVLSPDEEDFLDASAARDADTRRLEQVALRVQRRRITRLRVLLGSVAALLAVALTAVGVAAVSQQEARDRAREVAAARLGDLAGREPRADTALLAARQAVELASTPQTSADLLRAVDATADIRSVRETGITGFIGAQPQLSPDGSRILALQLDGVHLVDTGTGRSTGGGPAVPGEVPAALDAVGFVDGGRTALVSAGVGPDDPGRTCEIRHVDAVTGVVTGTSEPVPGSRCGDFFARDRMRVSSDGRVLVSLSGDSVRWWQRSRSGEGWEGPAVLAVPDLPPGTPVPRAVSVSADHGRACLVVEVSMAPPWYRSLTVPVVVDLAEGRIIGPVAADPDVARASISPDGRRLVVGGHDGAVVVRAVGARDSDVLSPGGQAGVSGLAWSADGGSVYVGRVDGRVDVVDVADDAGPSIRTSLPGHGAAVSTLGEAGLGDGPGLVSLDDAGTAIVRTLGTVTALGARRAVDRPQSVAVMARGGPVLAGGEGGAVAVYTRPGLAREPDLTLVPGALPPPSESAAVRRRVTALAASPDGRSVVAADRTGRLTVWAWPSREVRWTRDDAPAAFLAVTPDGRLLVTAELTLAPDDPQPDGYPESSRVRVWDLATGEQLASMDSGGRKPRAVAVSPDSRTAVVAFFGDGNDVVDLAGRRVVATLDGGMSALAFDPDGARLVAVDFDGQGQTYSTDDWSPESSFTSLAGGYAHLATDGRLLFLSDGTDVAVWDAVALRRLEAGVSLRGDGTNDALYLGSPPDEPLLAVASQHELALVDLREALWRDTACRLAARPLTRDEWHRLLPDRDYEPACR